MKFIQWRLLILMCAAHSFFGATVGFCAQVPLLDDGTFIRIPVNIFGETNYFIVDTGANITVIDTSLESKLGKPLKSAAAEAAVGGQFDATLYAAPAMRIGDHALTPGRVAVVNLQMARMISGEPCVGMLGADAFSNSVVFLDFERNLFSVWQQKDLPKNESSIALRKLPDNRLAVEAMVNHSEKVLLLIDSSDSSSLTFNQQDWENIFKARSASVGKISHYSDVSGAVRKSQTARLESLTVGGQEHTNLLCSLIPNPGSTSHLGLSFFRRHVITIDFAQPRMFLERRSPFIRGDEDDMSGLHLIRKDGAVIVYAVDRESPAALAGFVAGDELTKINGTKAAAISMWQIRRIFLSGNGNVVIAEIKSNGKSRLVNLQLKRAI